MARVAFVMDKLLRKIGLSGRSIVPMLVGFGCTVPGVMASRTLSSERDRKMTILLTPFMSCSAKISIYAFFAAAFFGKRVGAICGGVGMALSDVLSPWIVYAPATLIVVGLMGFVFGLIVKKKPTIVNLIVATVVVLAIKLVGYYLFEVLLTSSFVVPLASIPGNIMQIVTGAIIAIPIILVSRVGMAKVKRSMEA